jgi:hypothetical protein
MFRIKGEQAWNACHDHETGPNHLSLGISSE